MPCNNGVSDELDEQDGYAIGFNAHTTNTVTAYSISAAPLGGFARIANMRWETDADPACWAEFGVGGLTLDAENDIAPSNTE